MKIVLCRHTQTDHNAARFYTGQIDVPLNNIGEDQARRLAQRVAQLPGVQAIYSSDLLRTRRLATLIHGAMSPAVDLVFTADLREVDIGQMAGLPKPEAIVRFPEERYRTANPQFDFREIGGEDHRSVLDRHFRVIETVRKRFGGCVVFVGHGSSLRRVFAHELVLINELHEQGDYQTVEI